MRNCEVGEYNNMLLVGLISILPMVPSLIRNPCYQGRPTRATISRGTAVSRRAIIVPRPFQILAPRGMILSAGDQSVAWRSPDGHVYVKASSLEVLGLKLDSSEVLDGKARLRLDGDTIMEFTPAVAPGRPWDKMVSLSDIATATKSKLLLDPKGPLVRVQTTISGVFLEKGGIRFNSRLPVRPILIKDKQNGKVIIDIPGANISETTVPTEFDTDTLTKVRAGQYQPNIARLVIETKSPDMFRLVPSGEGATEWMVTTNVKEPLPIAVSMPISTLPMGNVTLRSTTFPRTVAPFVSTIRDLHVNATQQGFDFSIDFAKFPWFKTLLVDNVFILDLATENPSAEIMSIMQNMDHTLVSSVNWESNVGWGIRLTIQLSQSAHYQVRVDPAGRLLISIKELTGDLTAYPLIGKTIIVDPGHGGPGSTGTRGVDGRLEKNNTLPIALGTAAHLDSLGANVILTRDYDIDPGLKERPAIANRVDADIFVSIHCNDGSRNKAANGSLIFYHMDSLDCKALARKISDRLAADFQSIRAAGIRSDKLIYVNDGFAVLRLSQMAGVLVEAGFMSNVSDAAALASPANQQSIGIAIARGISDFLLEDPNRDTRYSKRKQPVVPATSPTVPPAENDP